MPDLIRAQFGQGLFADYDELASKSQYQVYFTTDTHQIFVGADEYTKGTKVLSAVPTESTPGDKDRLYFVNNSLYLCGGEDETPGTYIWTRVANLNDFAGVTSVAAGEGLETDVTGGGAITETGTISHSVPSGATTVVDPTADASAAFGSTFAIQGVATDKFGHVTASNTRTITMPTETEVSVTDTTGTATALAYGSTFSVISAVDKGTGSHEIEAEATVFTLPESDDTTYTISSVEEGVITLTDSNANSTTALINGWNDLAKKSELSSVFKYRGSVATVADLPSDATVKVGDVYQVAAGPQGSACEYVAVTDGPNATWEELGTTIDLSAYATTADLAQATAWNFF